MRHWVPKKAIIRERPVDHCHHRGRPSGGRPNHNFRFFLVRGWCGFCRTLPYSAKLASFLSLRSRARNFRSAYRGSNPWGAANTSSVCRHLAQIGLPSVLDMACRNLCAGMGYHHYSSAAIVAMYGEERPVDHLSDSAPSVLEGSTSRKPTWLGS